VQPLQKIEPRVEPDWTSRNWENEARAASAAMKDFPQIYGNRVTYYIIYATSYVMTSEGTTIRSTRSLASIESGMDTEADDGMGLHNYYAAYATRPGDLPDVAAVTKGLTQAGNDSRHEQRND
jgi:hypothetical protein